MKKRSQLTLKGLIELVAVAAVIVSLIYVGKSIGSGEAYFKDRTAKELALLVNTLCSLPGNAEITFPTDLSGFNIGVEDNLAYVYDPQLKKDTDPTAGRYPISKPDCDVEGTIRNPKTLIVKKQEGKVSFVEGNVKIA